MAEHYLTCMHQDAIIQVVRQWEHGSRPVYNDRIAGMDIDMAPTTMPHRGSDAPVTTSEASLSPMQDTYEMINVLAGAMQALNDDTQRLSSESVRLQAGVESLTKDCAIVKQSIQEQSVFLDGIKPNQEILQQEVASLKQTIDDLQYVSYDGTLLWKISSFQEKMSECW
jgi:hypothetical protein